MTPISADSAAALVGAFGAVLVLFIQWMKEFFQEVSSRDKWIGRLRRISPEVNAALTSLVSDGRGVFSFMPPLLAVVPLLVFLIPPMGNPNPIARIELCGTLAISGFLSIHLLGVHALPRLLHSKATSDVAFRSKVSNRYMLLYFHPNYLGACIYVAGTNAFDLVTSGTSVQWQDLSFGLGFLAFGAYLILSNYFPLRADAQDFAVRRYALQSHPPPRIEIFLRGIEGESNARVTGTLAGVGRGLLVDRGRSMMEEMPWTDVRRLSISSSTSAPVAPF